MFPTSYLFAHHYTNTYIHLMKQIAHKLTYRIMMQLMLRVFFLSAYLIITDMAAANEDALYSTLAHNTLDRHRVVTL